MTKAVFDTNLFVSAFLTREAGGVSNELLRFVREGTVDLHVSPEIIAETLATLVTSVRLQERYAYDAAMAIRFCDDLCTVTTPVVDPPPAPGAVPRDPDDDKIIACAIAAGAEFLVTRDRDLLSLGSYAGVAIVAPEDFLHRVRAQSNDPSSKAGEK